MERSTIGGSEWDLRRGDGGGNQDEPPWVLLLLLVVAALDGISASTPESQAE